MSSGLILAGRGRNPIWVRGFEPLPGATLEGRARKPDSKSGAFTKFRHPHAGQKSPNAGRGSSELPLVANVTPTPTQAVALDNGATVSSYGSLGLALLKFLRSQLIFAALPPQHLHFPHPKQFRGKLDAERRLGACRRGIARFFQQRLNLSRGQPFIEMPGQGSLDRAAKADAGHQPAIRDIGATAGTRAMAVAGRPFIPRQHPFNVRQLVAQSVALDAEFLNLLRSQ